MGREPRHPGHSRAQHVTTRGNNRQTIFLDDADHLAFLTLLGQVSAQHRWHTLAYCLMPNHIHLMIEASPHAMSSGMRDLLGRYVRRFHRRHGTSGHLLGRRFHNVPIEDDRQAAAVVRYIAANPVEAGLCASAADWPWSSFKASIGEAVPPGCLDAPRLWSLLGATPQRAQDHIRALVNHH